jgi:hypothetical protein
MYKKQEVIITIYVFIHWLFTDTVLIARFYAAERCEGMGCYETERTWPILGWEPTEGTSIISLKNIQVVGTSRKDSNQVLWNVSQTGCHCVKLPGIIIQCYCSPCR